MSDQNRCRQISELFPLYYNSGLEQAPMDALRSHLECCPDCRDAYAQERVLFALAANDSPTVGLDSHADSDLLDQYAHDRGSLGSDQRSEFEAHLAECRLCMEAVEKLAALPTDFSKLIPSHQLPLISELNRLSEETPSRSNITDLTRRVWRPLAAIAAAAVIIVVSVTLMTYDESEPSAKVEGTFPAATRSVSAPTVFETTTEQFTFAGRIFVDPEESHDYSIQVRELISDSLIFQSGGRVNMDSRGFAHLELAMTPGRYELVLWDIEGTDSISITRRFEIRLSR